MKDAMDDGLLLVLKNIEWDVSQIKQSTQRIEKRLTIMECNQMASGQGGGVVVSLRERIEALEEKIAGEREDS